MLHPLSDMPRFQDTALFSTKTSKMHENRKIERISKIRPFHPEFKGKCGNCSRTIGNFENLILSKIVVLIMMHPLSDIPRFQDTALFSTKISKMHENQKIDNIENTTISHPEFKGKCGNSPFPHPHTPP